MIMLKKYIYYYINFKKIRIVNILISNYQIISNGVKEIVVSRST